MQRKSTSRPRVGRALAAALERVLRPLFRIVLRNHMSFKAFLDIAKHAYVEVAATEFRIPGKKQSISRIALLSGLTRKEVHRVLDELLRVGVVEKLDDGNIRLKTRAYIPESGDTDKLNILGTDVSDLVATIDHNLQHGAADPFFQRKVMYDNIPVEALQEFRRLSGAQAQALLERLDKWLSQHDRDTHPETTGTGRMRTGIGIYYFEEKMSPQNSKDS